MSLNVPEPTPSRRRLPLGSVVGRVPILFAVALLAGSVLASEAPEIPEAPETELLLLSGRGFDDARAWDFRCSEGRRCQGLEGPWDSIPVPSQWEQHGFGHYDYGHEEDKHDESAEYRLRFRVPAHWQDRRIEVVFDGVMTDAEVRLDGEPVGERHQGGFYRFSRELTGLVAAGGEHELGVRVWKVSEDRSVELAERDADYWVFGGIYRPVWLRATPRAGIDRVALDPLHDGRFSALVALRGLGPLAGDALRLRLVLEDLDQRTVTEPVEIALDGGPLDRALVATRFEDILPWSAEAPHLYLARFELLRDGEVLHRVRQRFGFRTVELREDGLYVNDRRTRLRGINRHAFWPETGRTSSPELDRRDAELIRGLGFNAVRASHYPPDEPFLDACDEVGLYVIDELTGWHDAYSTRAGRPLVKAMVERDVDHPSILFWANGNEDGWNTKLDGDFHLHDPQARPVIHPRSYQHDQPQRPGLPNWNMDLPHYPNWQELKATLDDGSLLNRWRRNRQGRMPLVLPTEALHGLYDGGSGAGLQDYWRALTESERGVGLFLWVFTDEAIRRTDSSSDNDIPELDTDGNHAPDGILGPYREPSGQVEAIRQVFAPLQIESDPRHPDWDRTLRIRNRLSHLDTGQVRIHWQLLPPTDLRSPGIEHSAQSKGPDAPGIPGYGGRARGASTERTCASPTESPSDDRAEERTEALDETEPARVEHRAQPPGPDAPWGPRRGVLELPSVPTDTSLDLSLPLPEGFRDYEALRICAVDVRPLDPSLTRGWQPEDGTSEGRRLLVDLVLPLRRAVDEARARRLAPGPAVQVEETAEGWRVRAGERGIELASDGSPLALLGPEERQPLPLPVAVGSAEPSRPVAHRRLEDGLEVAYRGLRLRWQVFPSGWVRLAWHGVRSSEGGLAGLVLPFEEEAIESLRFVGHGPSRVWGNRPQGRWGSHRREKRGAVEPQWAHEPQWRGYYRVRRAALDTSRGVLGLAFEDESSVLGLFAPHFPGDAETARAEVHRPDGLAFVENAPAIGTKFSPSEELGPEPDLPPSELFHGAVWLWAGEPPRELPPRSNEDFSMP